MHRAVLSRGLWFLAVVALLSQATLPTFAESQRVIDDNTWVRGKLRAQQWFDLDGWDLTPGIPDLPTSDRIRWYYDDTTVPGHLYMSRGGESWQEIIPGNGSGISGGTANAITKYTGSTSIAPSLITDDGTNVGLPSGTGVGTASPNAKAAMEVASTTKGFLGPRLTSTQRDAITVPPEGLQIYNTTTHQIEVWNGSAWVAAAASGISGAGTTNKLTKWTSSSAVGASSISDDGSTVSVQGDLAASGVLKLNGVAVSDVSGILLPAALPTVPLSKGGTNAADAATARINLGLSIGTDVPSPTGTGASGTWGISVSGNAANVSGTVAADHGGTGITSPIANRVMIGNGTGYTLGILGDGLMWDGTTLISTGSGGVTGTGSANVFPLWNGTSSLSTSPLTNPTSSALEIAEAASPGVGNSGKARLFADSADHALKMSLNGGAIRPIGTQTVFDVKSYGAKADAGTVKLTLNAGSITACADGTIACSGFTTAAYSGAAITIPNALETAMNASDTGSTLGAAIASMTVTSLTLSAPASGTDWASVLPHAENSLLVDNEIIGCGSVSGNVLSGCTRGSEGTTAATHSIGASVRIYGLDIVDAGAYTAVHSYSFPIHSMLDLGRKLVIPSLGWTYASPGIIAAVDPAGFSGANETGWYARVLPRATSTGTGNTGSIFSTETATIGTINGSHVPTLTAANGTMSANISSQTETTIVGHDDTPAFQAAIDAASAAGGGVVKFPPGGSYYLGSPWQWKSHVTIDAEGATIYAPGSASGPDTDYNSGSTGLPGIGQALGTYTLDDVQMSTFGYNSGIVNPVFLDAGGSLTVGTNYYYKITGLDNSSPQKETALSTTVDFGTPTTGNQTLRFTVLKSTFSSAIHDYRIWRSDGLDAAGNYRWKLWKSIPSATATSDPTYVNPGHSALLEFKDDGSITPDGTVAPPDTNQTVTPIVDIAWHGGTVIGGGTYGAGAQYFLSTDFVDGLTIDGLTLENIGDCGIKLQRTKNAVIRNCTITGGGHGIVVEDSQHVLLDHNTLSGNSVIPSLTYHAQAFSPPSPAVFAANSTGNPSTVDVIWRNNDITGGCADYGVHCQSMIAYGVEHVSYLGNAVHDAWVDVNNSFQSQGALWSPVINHDTTQGIRLRDSEGEIGDNHIVSAGQGILIDSQLDFEDFNINGTNATPYDDRPLEGGRVVIHDNTIEHATIYGIEVANSNFGVPTASTSPVVNTGTYSTCPVDRNGALLGTMGQYTSGQTFAPEMIPPVTITHNQILHTGYGIPSVEANAIQCYSSYSQINNNLIDGVNSLGIIININRPSGATFQPTDVTMNGNILRNVGRGTKNNIDWKVGIFYLGLRGHINSNTFLAQDSGSLSGSTAIKLGYSGAAPWNAASYSAEMSGNTFSNFAVNLSKDPAAGQTALALDSANGGRQAANAGSALATSNFGSLTGWGTGAAITSVTAGSTDSTGQVTITAGTSPSSNPNVTLTYKDGAWSVAPFGVASMDGSSTGTLGAVAAQTTTTTLVLTYIGTPGAGTYKLNWSLRQ